MKDSNGNLILPKWAVGALVAFGGAGAGTGAVTVYKVDALAVRFVEHEVKPSHDSVLTGGPWKIVNDRNEELKRAVEALRTVAETNSSRLARIETILEEIRRPR